MDRPNSTPSFSSAPTHLAPVERPRLLDEDWLAVEASCHSRKTVVLLVSLVLLKASVHRKPHGHKDTQHERLWTSLSILKKMYQLNRALSSPSTNDNDD
jgi:hypothetical protein